MGENAARARPEDVHFRPLDIDLDDVNALDVDTTIKPVVEVNHLVAFLALSGRHEKVHPGVRPRPKSHDTGLRPTRHNTLVGLNSLEKSVEIDVLSKQREICRIRLERDDPASLSGKPREGHRKCSDVRADIQKTISRANEMPKHRKFVPRVSREFTKLAGYEVVRPGLEEAVHGVNEFRSHRPSSLQQKLRTHGNFRPRSPLPTSLMFYHVDTNNNGIKPRSITCMTARHIAPETHSHRSETALRGPNCR